MDHESFPPDAEADLRLRLAHAELAREAMRAMAIRCAGRMAELAEENEALRARVKQLEDRPS